MNFVQVTSEESFQTKILTGHYKLFSTVSNGHTAHNFRSKLAHSTAPGLQNDTAYRGVINSRVNFFFSDSRKSNFFLISPTKILFRCDSSLDSTLAKYPDKAALPHVLHANPVIVFCTDTPRQFGREHSLTLKGEVSLYG